MWPPIHLPPAEKKESLVSMVHGEELEIDSLCDVSVKTGLLTTTSTECLELVDETSAYSASSAATSAFRLEGVDGDWEEIIDDLVATFEKQHKRKLTFSISFY
ncbi:hypothetical protein ACP70R_020006 [Stipagrostis hirtigluma subsp. patula]